MALARTLIVLSLTVSLFTFVAFFGRLPAFRNTPIGFLNRLFVLHIPSLLRRLDAKLTNGRITSSTSRLGHHLMYDKHPVIVVFFLGLVSACAVLLLPAIWSTLRASHKLMVLFLLPQPYFWLYLSAKSNKTTHITPLNHAAQMRHYPYDRVLYHPGNTCSTCKALKPARSKHCSICKTCVSRMDHHCIWVNNCLGRGNYKYFLMLLLSTSVLIAYGAYLAWFALSPVVASQYNAHESRYRYKSAPGADTGGVMAWSMARAHYFAVYLSLYLDRGGLATAGVGLLALLTWPLPLGLLAYHVYLIWAGMTTNESSKWADWREDMSEGVVFLGTRREDTLAAHREDTMHREDTTHHQGTTHRQDTTHCQATPPPHPRSRSPASSSHLEEPPTSWPLESRHILVRTRDGQVPKALPARVERVAAHESFERVWTLAAVENVYDLGFWDNLAEVVWH